MHGLYLLLTYLLLFAKMKYLCVLDSYAQWPGVNNATVIGRGWVAMCATLGALSIGPNPSDRSPDANISNVQH